jgi:hypothetical protein
VVSTKLSGAGAVLESSGAGAGEYDDEFVNKRMRNATKIPKTIGYDHFIT